MDSIKVVYLSRFANDSRFSWAFFRSLSFNPAGVDFDLVVASKGYAGNDTDPSLSEWREKINCKNIYIESYDDDVTPLYICYDLARKFPNSFIVFFVSWSRILAPFWLRHYVSAFESVANCGVVSATAGYERLGDGTTFPNVGVRTNAFMISASLFLQLEPGDASTLWGGNLFEAGPNGMTKQIMAKGRVPVVVDRFGTAWTHEQWPKSKTFRTSQQEGLLVADNRTYRFHVAGLRKRRRLALRCWGTSEGIRPRPLMRKFADWYDWNFPRGWQDLSSDAIGKVCDIARSICRVHKKKPRKIFPS